MKIRWRSILLIFLLIFFTCTSFFIAGGQTYPTLLSVRYSEGEMIIEFEPLERRDVLYRIYRSESAITGTDALADAVLIAEITGDRLPFIDRPAENGAFNYAVTYRINGMENELLVPFQNVTMYPVEYSPFPAPVHDLRISQINSKEVKISFVPEAPVAAFNLYTSSKQFTETQTGSFVTEGEPAESGKGKTDFPAPDGEPAESGQGETGTFAPAGEPAATETEKNYFIVPAGPGTSPFFAVTTVNRLGVENRKLTPGENTNPTPFTLRVEPEKKPAPAGPAPEIVIGELIDRNLRYNFYRGRYGAALRAFSRILSREGITERQEALVQFYMGQCEYYLGNKKTALKYFIDAKETDEYRVVAAAWIDRILSEIRLTDESGSGGSLK